ncbi:MAG TPA: hypothetical protein DEB39_02825 [Planctomycetaceae bacterium]|nr:hypothetical protein [Planctomycetaceae bacterium]
MFTEYPDGIPGPRISDTLNDTLARREMQLEMQAEMLPEMQAGKNDSGTVGANRESKPGESAPGVFLRNIDTVRGTLRSRTIHGGLLLLFLQTLVVSAVLGTVDFLSWRFVPSLETSPVLRGSLFLLFVAVFLNGIRSLLVLPLRSFPCRAEIGLRLASGEFRERMRQLPGQPVPGWIESLDRRACDRRFVDRQSRERQTDLLDAAVEFIEKTENTTRNGASELRAEVVREADRLIPEGSAERFFRRNRVFGFREYAVAATAGLLAALLPFAVVPEHAETALRRILLPFSDARWSALTNIGKPSVAGNDKSLSDPPDPDKVKKNDMADTPERISVSEARRRIERYLGIVRDELERIGRLQRRNRESLNETAQAVSLLNDQREIRRLLIDPVGGLPFYLEQLEAAFRAVAENEAESNETETAWPAGILAENRAEISLLGSSLVKLDTEELGPLESLFGEMIRSDGVTTTDPAARMSMTAIILRQQRIEAELHRWYVYVRQILVEMELGRRWNELLDRQYDVSARSRDGLRNTLGLSTAMLPENVLETLQHLAMRQREIATTYTRVVRDLHQIEKLDRSWEPKLRSLRRLDVAATMEKTANDLEHNRLGEALRRQTAILRALGGDPDRFAEWERFAAAKRRSEPGAGDETDDETDNETGNEKDRGEQDASSGEYVLEDAGKEQLTPNEEGSERVESDRAGEGAGDGSVLAGSGIGERTGTGLLNPLRKYEVRRSWGELIRQEKANNDGNIPREEVLPGYREETERYFRQIKHLLAD